MYRILLLLFTAMFLIQCSSVQQALSPVLSNQKQSNNTTTPAKNELTTQGEYPKFTVGASNEDYHEIFGNMVPPTKEEAHANSAISAFSELSSKQSNAIMSPFLFTCNNKGQASLNTLSGLTKGKLNIGYNADKTKFGIEKAVYFSSSWQQTSQATQVNFSQAKLSGINIVGKCYYYDSADMQLICLPLDHDFSAYLFVPSKSSTVSQLLANMKFAQMNDAIQRLKKVNCEVSLPAFRVYSNFARQTTQGSISMLQFDQNGCEFVSVHTRWAAIITNEFLKGFSVGSQGWSDDSSFSDEELDLAKIKSPYLKDVPQESVKIVVDRPFFLVLRHLFTGEFLATAAINNLNTRADWQSVVQHVNNPGAQKSSTLERFGWSYTRKIDPQSTIE